MYIMVHRYVKDKTDTEITYINADNINFFSACADGKGTRISMPNCFFLVEEDVSAIMSKIRWEVINRER